MSESSSSLGRYAQQSLERAEVSQAAIDAAKVHDQLEEESDKKHEQATLDAILSIEPSIQLNMTEEFDYQNPEIGAIVYKSYAPQVCGKIVTLEQRKEWYGKPHEKFIWYAGVKWLKKGNPITEEMVLDLRSYHVLMEDHRRKFANMRHQLAKLRNL